MHASVLRIIYYSVHQLPRGTLMSTSDRGRGMQSMHACLQHSSLNGAAYSVHSIFGITNDS